MNRVKRALLRICVVAVSCGLSALPAKLLASPGQSAWFGSGTPVFTTQNATVSDNELPTTFIQHGNVDCSNLEFTKRNGAIIAPLFYSESQLPGCFLDTTAGEVLDNGFIDVPGTPYVAETVHADHTPYQFFAFPGSDIFVSSQSGAPSVGNYVWLSHLNGAVRFTGSFNGKIWAEVNATTQSPIADKAGNKLPVLLDNMVGSSDGQWAVVDSPGHGIVRINLETMEVLPFADSLENGAGTGSAERIAISSDGRYVAVASKAFQFFRIFDLSTCMAVPNVIAQPVSCQSQDLDTYFRSKVTDLGGILQMRFVTNNQLKIYASYNISSGTKTGQFALAAPGTTLAGMEYLGMGDSFSSGEGSQNYEVGTDDPNNKCHLSKLSYPYLIARKLNFNSFHSVACSGAVTYNVIGGSGNSDDTKDVLRDNQYSNRPTVDPLGYWLPGYNKQLKFVTENQPQLITLSVIGNDLGFGAIAKACAKPGTCYPTYEDRQEVFKDVDSKLPALTKLYKKLKTSAPHDARIYAVGYPQIAVASGNCGLNVHMNQSELSFTETLITRIDQLIKTAANKAGVNYVDVEDAFFGHRLCEATFSDLAVNGITAGNDIFHVIGNESFHPNAYGQFLLAQKILGITNNLGAMPDNPNAGLTPLSDNSPALKDLPKTGRVLKRKATTSANNSTVAKGKPTTVKINGHDYALAPNTTYTLTLNGLANGTTTSGNNGDITISIPTNQPGTQTVDIDGSDVTNQPVVVSTSVDVIDPDNPSACGVIPASNQDIDQDGIDDACDPAIGPAPVTTSNPTPPTTTPIPPSASPGGPAASSTTTTTAADTTSNSQTNQTPINITAGVSTESTKTSPTTTQDSHLFDAQIVTQDANIQAESPARPKATQTVSNKVLGEATSNLKAAASSTKQGLLAMSATHPIAFSGTVITLLLLVLTLTYLHLKTRQNKNFRPAFA